MEDAASCSAAATAWCPRITWAAAAVYLPTGANATLADARAQASYSRVHPVGQGGSGFEACSHVCVHVCICAWHAWVRLVSQVTLPQALRGFDLKWGEGVYKYGLKSSSGQRHERRAGSINRHANGSSCGMHAVQSVKVGGLRMEQAAKQWEGFPITGRHGTKTDMSASQRGVGGGR